MKGYIACLLSCLVKHMTRSTYFCQKKVLILAQISTLVRMSTSLEMVVTSLVMVVTSLVMDSSR